ncbi:MAG: hypothetical protein ACI4QY_02290 [Oscillospiraceae bacterium]
MKKPFSFEQFLWIFERDNIFLIDETMFYFDDDPTKTEHYLGCLRKYDKPYWAGYCDVPDGCEFQSASELLNAKIYDGLSIKDRWKNIVFVNIGGIGFEDWLISYQDKF